MQGVIALVIALLAALGSVGKLLQSRLNFGKRGEKARKREAAQESHLSAAGGLPRPAAAKEIEEEQI